MPEKYTRVIRSEKDEGIKFINTFKHDTKNYTRNKIDFLLFYSRAVFLFDFHDLTIISTASNGVKQFNPSIKITLNRITVMKLQHSMKLI